MFVEDVSGTPQGGIIVRYPDVAEPQVQYLSEQLRHHGWSSLLVPIASSLAGKVEAVDSEEPIEHIKQVHGQHNLVLLTLGDAWDQNLELAESETENGATLRPIQAIVMIDVPGEINPTRNVPTLDITTTVSPIYGYQDRQRFARRESITTNQALTIRYSTKRSTRATREDFLTRRIRGWLHNNAQGMEVTGTGQ